jgi:hypothetical protein
MDLNKLKALLKDLNENFNELYGFTVEMTGEESEDIITYSTRFDMAMEAIESEIEKSNLN